MRPNTLRLAFLRTHGLYDSALQTVYRAVVVAKLTNDRFSSAIDCQKIYVFIRRSKCTGFSSSQPDDFSSLCSWYSTIYWDFTQSLPCPPSANHNCNLRDRLHKRQLPDRMSHLTSCNFTVRMLFCGSHWMYWLYLLSCILFVSMYNCSLTIDSLEKHLTWFLHDRL